MSCTVTHNLKIVEGTRADYESLSYYHYREHNLGPYAAIYTLKGKFRTAENVQTVGIIVYAMPAAGCQMRTVAIPFLSGLDRITRLKLINANIRTISRVIIEPRFRSLGLAARLVKQTLPMLAVPFIEALAVMGQVNPFFEKAGMTRIDAPASVSVLRLIEAFSAVGIDRQDLIDPILVQQKLDSLSNDFIERELTRFLQAYGQRRLMQPGLDRTKFILSKLTDGALSGVPAGGRPVYFFWKNPNRDFGI
jgi:hypothetical protein